MTQPELGTRRQFLRLAGATLPATYVAACSPHDHSSTKLPHVFEGDEEAQYVAGRLVASAMKDRDRDLAHHEQFMRRAMELADENPAYPFGAVIVDYLTSEVLGQGASRGAESPLLHGEILAMNDYIDRHGNTRWDRTTLYSTGEPCAMCCGALAWVGIPRVVWASSIDAIHRSGIPQINISAVEMAARAYDVYKPVLYLGGILADEMDKRFADRRR